MVKTFTVTGKLPFPVDMLRYDSAWPNGSNDSISIEAALSLQVRPRGTARPPYSITLCTNDPHAPTRARWESFMWKVVN